MTKSSILDIAKRMAVRAHWLARIRYRIGISILRYSTGTLQVDGTE